MLSKRTETFEGVPLEMEKEKEKESWRPVRFHRSAPLPTYEASSHLPYGVLFRILPARLLSVQNLTHLATARANSREVTKW